MGHAEYLLKIQNLVVHYRTPYGTLRAVDDVNLTVGKNEIGGLVGESGCGKSTIALSVMGLLPVSGVVSQGKILFENRNLLELNPKEMQKVRGRKIAMVFQDPMTFLNPVMKVGDQMAEILLKHQGKSKEEAKEIVIAMLKRVGMPSPERIFDCYPHQLSGGMKQRIIITMALLCEPPLIILDEPTSALDVTVQAQILEFIKKLTREFAFSALLITHDLGIVADICDRVYVMYAGKIVESANVFTLYEDPKHPYTCGLLASALSIDEFKHNLVTIEGGVPNMLNPPSGCRFHPRCPKRMHICQINVPPLVNVDSDHQVACHLYNGDIKDVNSSRS